MFHDAVIVTAILDRLLHHCAVVNIRGHSYRLKGKVASDAARDASVSPQAPKEEPGPTDCATEEGDYATA